METLLIGWFVFIVYLYVLLLGGGPIRNAIKSVEILQSGLKHYTGIVETLFIAC